MLCPKCYKDWTYKIIDNHKRRVCSACGYVDIRESWVDGEYVGPPKTKPEEE